MDAKPVVQRIAVVAGAASLAAVCVLVLGDGRERGKGVAPPPQSDARRGLGNPGRHV